MAVRSSSLMGMRLWLQAPSQSEEQTNLFQNIYDEFHPFVRKTLFFLVGDSHLDDLTQEVFLKIWKNQSSFRGDSSTKTWIYRITVNTAYDFLRKEKKPSNLNIERVSSELPFSPDGIDIKEVVRGGILHLPEKQRAVFVLFYQEELSVNEIAKVLQISSGTIKSRLSYARKAIVKYFEKHGVHYE